MTTVLIMTDGLRPDALDRINSPHIDRICQEGAWTLTAQSVMPSFTLPCHMSIFHSVPPARHGVTQNLYQPPAGSLPGLFDIARAGRLKCAAFYGWEPLRDLGRPETLHAAYFRDLLFMGPEGDEQLAAAAASYIRDERPDFVFVYLGQVDIWGHVYGWMSPAYLAQAERLDRAVGIVLDSLTGADSVVLHSDHGGHEQTHGTERPEDMTIPWMAMGPMVRPGHRIAGPVTLLESAPTLARLLGLSPPAAWEGTVVEEIFR